MRLQLGTLVAWLLVVVSNAGAVDIYVSDHAGNTVKKYDGANGSTAAGWTNPSGVTNAVGVGVDASGYLYAVSETNGTLKKYDSSGTLVAGYSVTGLSGPRGVAIDSNGTAYVANATSGLITVYDSVGNQTKSNLLGFAVGSPYGVALDQSGNLFVAAQSTGVIYKVDKSTGSTSAGWSNVTSYNSPTGLAVDASGNLYVSSYNGGYISKYNGTSGAGISFTSPQWNSSFLPGPEGIAIEGDNLYVAITNTVAKYSLTTSQAVPGWTNPALDSDMIAIYVPEPSTYALAAIATGVMAAIARRRKARQG